MVTKHYEYVCVSITIIMPFYSRSKLTNMLCVIESVITYLIRTCLPLDPLQVDVLSDFCLSEFFSVLFFRAVIQEFHMSKVWISDFLTSLLCHESCLTFSVSFMGYDNDERWNLNVRVGVRLMMMTVMTIIWR